MQEFSMYMIILYVENILWIEVTRNFQKSKFSWMVFSNLSKQTECKQIGLSLMIKEYQPKIQPISASFHSYSYLTSNFCIFVFVWCRLNLMAGKYCFGLHHVTPKCQLSLSVMCGPLWDLVVSDHKLAKLGRKWWSLSLTLLCKAYLFSLTVGGGAGGCWKPHTPSWINFKWFVCMIPRYKHT